MFFSGFSKAQFKCPVQHFEKMMIKVNFTFSGWFRTLCAFLLWQERLSGVSNPQTKCTEEKFIEIFSVAKVLSKHFQISSREFWSFSRKVPAWLSQLQSLGPEEHFRSKNLKQVLKHINFFWLSVKFLRQHRKNFFEVYKTAKISGGWN